MINTTTGTFNVTDMVVINPLATINTLIDFFKTNNAEKWDVGNDWVHYYLKNLKIDQYYFFFDFMFFKNVLNRVDFCFYHQPVKNASWDDWSEENELMKQQEYEAWLQTEVGSSRNYKWGGISSYYDSKGGSSGIMIKYYNNNT